MFDILINKQLKKTKVKNFIKNNIIEVIFISSSAIVLLGLGIFLQYSYGRVLSIELIKGKITRKIYSLKSNSQLRGRFVLGTGRIREEDYYFFFSKDEKMDGFIKEKTLARETLLVEKDTVPFVAKNFLIEKRVYKRFFNSDRIYYDTIQYGFLKKPSSDVGYKYILTVPRGTVTENQVFEPL